LPTPLPNPSLQVTADHRLKQVDAPVYAPAAGEVLLHIKATGVCGFVAKTVAKWLCLTNGRSDIHFWKTGRIGPLVVEGDCILGHEAAGIVLQCGEGVRNLKPGG
jgi:L-iditol 2-dehydrogenase